MPSVLLCLTTTSADGMLASRVEGLVTLTFCFCFDGIQKEKYSDLRELYCPFATLFKSKITSRNLKYFV